MVSTSSRRRFDLLERMAYMASSAVTKNIGGLFKPFRHALGRPLTQSLKGATASELRGQGVIMTAKLQKPSKHRFRRLQTSLKPKVGSGSLVCSPVLYMP